MKSLSDRWSSWETRFEEEKGLTNMENHINRYWMDKVAIKDLVEDGFAVPTSRDAQDAWAIGLEPLPVYGEGRGRSAPMVNYVHLLNLVWQPVLLNFEILCKNEAPVKHNKIATNEMAVSMEMVGIVDSPEEVMPLEEWVEFLKNEILKHVGVDVLDKLILQVVSPFAPVIVPCTPANAMHLLRSSLCSKLVGSALATKVSRRVLSEVAELPVPLVPEVHMQEQIQRDLINALTELHCEPAEDEEVTQRPPKKARKGPEDINENMRDKTKQVLFMLENRMPAMRVKASVIAANQLIRDIQHTSSPGNEQEPLEDLLVSKWTLVRHMLLLDGALDRCTSDVLFQKREQGTFAGVALATDESPPNAPRFRGLRFQITVMYMGTFAPVSSWESMMEPPMSCTSVLGDIMHCPGKRGTDVSHVVDKQLARQGLNAYDVVGGTGDGGGENEGHQGLHAHYESLNPGYVRKRCVPHISWRTCDMAIRASGLDYKALAAYLVEGVTWSRLREIAVKAPADGGLQLFSDGSAGCQNLFGCSPSAIILTRPETDLQFLKLLSGKEHLLHRLASKDLEQRRLGAETRAAIQNLGDLKQRCYRRVLAEILERCMYLLHWVAKHPIVATSDSWDDLLQRASSTILDLDITPNVLVRFSTSAEELRAMHNVPRTWVELAVHSVLGDADLVADRLGEALEFHRMVTDQAAAHLNLLAENTYRTPWLAAKLLSRDKILASTSASALVKHLVKTRPANRTAFEKHLVDNEYLWKPLEEFAKAEPPVLLWHGIGRYEALFKFLAPRFLLAPDHVLDAERVHARWQWVCSVKRGLRIHTLNAMLRLTHYLENNQSFPSDSEMLQHLLAERDSHKMNLQALEEAREVALGWRSAFLYRDRLGLSARESSLIAEDAAAPVVPAGEGGPFAAAWRNYMKTVLKRGFMYSLSSSPCTIFYIAENKTLAGKEDKGYQGEALGRKLAVSFFEKVGENLVQRVDRESMRLQQTLLTIAELLQTIGGVEVPHDPERTAAATEVLLEAQYQNLTLKRFVCNLEPAADTVHLYTLSDEVHAEEALALELPPDHRTKMVLARCLQLSEHLGGEETLQSAWSQPLAALQVRAAPLLPVPVVPPAAGVAPGRGRGRGKGRGAPPAAAAAVAAPPAALAAAPAAAPAPIAPAAPPPPPVAAPPAGRGGRGGRAGRRGRGRGRG